MFSGIAFRSKKGKDRILFRCEDGTLCYELKIQKDGKGQTAVCSTCLQLAELVPEDSRPLLDKCKIDKNNQHDMDPSKIHHLAGCLPKNYTDVISLGEHLSNRRSARLSAARPGLGTNSEHKSEDKSNNSSSSEQAVVGTGLTSGKDNSMYPLVVLQKKTPFSYMFRLPDNLRCYRFSLMNRSAKLLTYCTSCVAVQKRNTRKKNMQFFTVFSRKLDGCSLLVDPSSNHLKECKGYLCSDVLKRYNVVKEDQSDQSEFVLEKLQKKEYAIIYKLPAVDLCYKFYRLDRLEGGRLMCSTCTLLRNRKSGLPGQTYMRFSFFSSLKGCLAVFDDDPTASHRPDCTPLVYSEVMKNYDYVDDSTARHFLEHCYDGAVDDMDDVDDSNSTPKKTRLSLDETATDLSHEAVHDISMSTDEADLDHGVDYSFENDHPAMDMRQTVNEQSVILEQSSEKDVNMDTYEMDMVENLPEDNVVGISNEHHLGTDLGNVFEDTPYPVLYVNNTEVVSVSQVKKEVCARAAQAMIKKHTVHEPRMEESSECEDAKEHIVEPINEDCQVKAEDGSSDVLVIPQKDVSKKRRLRGPVNEAEDTKNVKKHKEGQIGGPTVEGIIVIGDVASAVKEKPIMDKFYYFGSFVASNLREMSGDSSSKKIIKINQVLNEECTLSQIKKEVYSRAALALAKDQTVHELRDGEDTKEHIKKDEERQNGGPIAEGIPAPGDVSSAVKGKPATDHFEYIGAFIALSLRAMSPASSSDMTTRIIQVLNEEEE